MILVPTLNKGGAERVVSRLSKEFSKNHAVDVVVFDSKKTTYQIGGRLIDLNTPSKSSYFQKILNLLTRIYKLIREIHCENPDKIISFMESSNIPIIIACIITRKRKILTISTRGNPQTFGASTRIAIKLLYKYAKIVVAVSEGVKYELVKLGVPDSIIITIPNPAPTKEELSFSRDELDINNYKPYILGLGHLSVEKNFCDLIEAFSKIKNKNINLVIIGSGNKEKELKNQIKRLDLDSRIFLLGSISNPFPAYLNAEAFILSSLYEGWPNVIIESMACNCAVISYDCPYGPSEIITHHENGLLVEKSNVNQLSQQIEYMLKNPQLREDFIMNAKEKLNAFEIKNIACAWLK